MIKGFNAQYMQMSKDNCIRKSTIEFFDNNCFGKAAKEFFAAHRTMLKIAGSFSVIFPSILIVERFTSYEIFPPITLSSRGLASAVSIGVCTVLSSIAKGYEESLAISEAKHQDNQVGVKV